MRVEREPGALKGRGFDSRDDGQGRVRSIIRTGMPEKMFIPPFPAPEIFHAWKWGECTTACSDTGEMGGKPRAAWAEKRSFPSYRCTKFPRCKDMGEMHGKGLSQPLEKLA